MSILQTIVRDMRIRNLVRRIGPVERFMWYRAAFFDPDLLRVFDWLIPFEMHNEDYDESTKVASLMIAGLRPEERAARKDSERPSPSAVC